MDAKLTCPWEDCQDGVFEFVLIELWYQYDRLLHVGNRHCLFLALFGFTLAITW